MKFTKQRRGESHFDTVRFADERCQEVWITNVSIYQDSFTLDQSIETQYRIELHLYNGFAFVKFFLEEEANDPKRYKMRGQDNNKVIGLYQIKKLFSYCVDVMKIYLEQLPENFVGFIGEPDKTDDEKGLVFPQRLRIYDAIINRYFVLPSYKINRGIVVTPFNMRLIRNCLAKNGSNYLTKKQAEHYRSFKYELSIREEEELLGMMTQRAAQKYLELKEDVALS